MKFKALGRPAARFTALETFPCPRRVVTVACRSDEVTARCPVTGQPDFYTVEIEYRPRRLCVESKSLKLYLQKFRETGIFCEDFARVIAEDLYKALKPHRIAVDVEQKARGGISIVASAEIP